MPDGVGMAIESFNNKHFNLVTFLAPKQPLSTCQSPRFNRAKY